VQTRSGLGRDPRYEPVDVSLVRVDALPFEHGCQRRQSLARRTVLHHSPGGAGFHRLAHLQHVARLVGRDRGDDRAFPRRQREQSFGVEPEKSLVDGCSAHPQFGADLDLADERAARQVAAENARLDMRVGAAYRRVRSLMEARVANACILACKSAPALAGREAFREAGGGAE
jgi:hypothetical protein